MIRIGIDVGGTNTDAVVMDGSKVLAGVKSPTTPDVMSGVVAAMKSALAASGLAPEAIDVVMIGTTHFTNAVVQRRDLAPTAAVRLGLPATASLPPMVDWPEDLRSAIGNHAYLAHGGHEFDGREISPLDEVELLRIAADIKAKNIRSVAVAAVFSPVNSDCEARAGEILARALPGVHVTLSSDIGRIGLLERENAAIMNACLRDLAKLVIDAFRERARRLRRQGALLSDAERRHADGRDLCRAVPGADLRQRPDQLDPGRRLPLRRRRGDRRRYRRHDLRRRRAAQGLSEARDRRGRGRRRAHQFPHAGRLLLRPRRRIAGRRRPARRHRRPEIGRLPADHRGAGVRRLDADHERYRRRGGPRLSRRPPEGRPSRPRPDRPHRGAHRRHAGSRGRAVAPVAGAAAGDRGRRRLDPGEGQDRWPRGRSSRTISPSPTRSARPSRRSRARPTGSIPSPR